MRGLVRSRARRVFHNRLLHSLSACARNLLLRCCGVDTSHHHYVSRIARVGQDLAYLLYYESLRCGKVRG